jgi:hypothetical protein
MQPLALSFEALTPLLGLALSSSHRGELYLMDGHCLLETGHLGHQSTDL